MAKNITSGCLGGELGVGRNEAEDILSKTSQGLLLNCVHVALQ